MFLRTRSSLFGRRYPASAILEMGVQCDGLGVPNVEHPDGVGFKTVAKQYPSAAPLEHT
jgi:hypothetical protein